MISTKAIASGAANLLVKRYLGPFWMRRRWLDKTQWLSKPELDQIQLKGLRKLVAHCYKTIPYYQQLMDERSITPSSINSLDDVKKFPILTKKDVVDAGESIVSNRYPMWMLRKGSTSGSTGTPMTVYRSPFSLGDEHAFLRRQWDWAGVGFRDKTAWIYQKVITSADKPNGRLYTYDPIMKELVMSAYHCSTRNALEYAQVIKDNGIKVLVGYPSSVYLIAKRCLESGFTLKLDVVLATWEAMTDVMRMTIIKAFGCEVFDYYGSGERVAAIHKCSHDSFHIIPEYGLTELIPIDNDSSKMCKVISTGFWNKAMPLIRYDMGDVVEKSDECCSCGRKFEVVKSIVGKEGDVIHTPSGIELGATAALQLLYVVGGIKKVRETQIIQDRLDHVTINFVPGDNFSEDDLLNMRRTVSKNMPSDLKVDIRQVRAVQRTSMGKVKPIISMITENYSKIKTAESAPQIA